MTCKLQSLWNPVLKAVGLHISHPPLLIYLAIVNSDIPTTEVNNTNWLTLQHLNTAVRCEMVYYQIKLVCN